MNDSFIKRLMTSVKCGICGRHYEVDSIDVLGRREDLWFLSVLCPACYTQCLVAVVLKEERVAELVTDLTEAELDKFSSMAVLTADEVLDMHEFLRDFDGDFSRLFSQEHI